MKKTRVAATLKKHKAEKSRVALVSESTEKQKPIFVVAGDDWLINGKAVGSIFQSEKSIEKY